MLRERPKKWQKTKKYIYIYIFFIVQNVEKKNFFFFKVHPVSHYLERTTVDVVNDSICWGYSSDQKTHMPPSWIWRLFYFVHVVLCNFFFFLGPHLLHTEVPRLGVKLELPAYPTATVTPDLSCICDLAHSSQKHQILNPLIEVRG